jgi:hypothetical protein
MSQVKLLVREASRDREIVKRYFVMEIIVFVPHFFDLLLSLSRIDNTNHITCNE